MKTKENLKSFSLIFSAVAFVAIATESNGNSSLEHFPADTVALSSSAIFATSTSPIAKPASSESKNTTNTSGLKHTDNSNLRSVVSHVSEKNSTLIGNNVTKSAVKSFSDSESKEIEEEEEQDFIDFLSDLFGQPRENWENNWISQYWSYSYDPETNAVTLTRSGTDMGQDSSSTPWDSGGTFGNFNITNTSNNSDNFTITTNNPNNHPSAS